MSTTVTGTIKKLDTTTPGVTAFVRFWLRGTRGNEPRITGTGAIAPQFSGSAFYVDLPADASGNISGTIYSTRDSAGTGAGDIEAGGSYTAVYYGMQIFNGGIAGPETPIHARSGGTLDIANVTPVSTLPVVTSPTGDTTYARIDGGNTPFSGAVSFGSTINATHGGTLGGAFTGSATLNVANAGVFTNTQQNLYVQSLLGGVNPTTEWNSIFNLPNHATEAITAGATVASGATVFQTNSVAGYVRNKNGATTAGVALFGLATADTTANGRVWGINTLATDVAGFPSSSIYAAEFDANLVNATSVTHGILITGFWAAQPTISVALEIGPIQSSGPSYVWPYGVRFDQGATAAPSTNNAALYFFPVASGVSQVSQGITFLGSNSGGTQNIASFVNLDILGNLNVVTTAANTGIVVNGTPLVPRVAAVDLTSQSAAITTTTLFAVVNAGEYRLSWNAKVTTAAGTSSTLGALTIVYTDPDGVVQTITCGAQTSAGAIATTSATNTTSAVLLGLPILLNCKAGTNITYAFGYASNAANAMNYNLHLRLESL